MNLRRNIQKKKEEELNNKQIKQNENKKSKKEI